MSRNANPVLALVRDDYDKGDPFGSALDALFAVCDGMYLAGLADEIPREWDYRPGLGLTGTAASGDYGALGDYMATEYPYLGEEVWNWLTHCEVCHAFEVGPGWETARDAGRALDKLVNLARLAGRGY